MVVRAHSGRRPGDSGTREAILAAARRQFAELGYDRTSMRQIALEAGVDPTLVSHFHGTKHELFLSVVELPFTPSEILPGLLAGDPEQLGERLARFAVAAFESEQGRSRIVSLIRAAASEPEAARLIRDLLTREVLTPLAAGIGSDDAAYRGSLVMSQMVGLIMARYIVGVEPIASRDAASIAAAIAPNLQHYLTGDLGTGAGPAAEPAEPAEPGEPAEPAEPS